jgi:hypothetical protein
MIIFTHIPRTSGKYIETCLFPKKLNNIKKFHKKLMKIGQDGSYPVKSNIDIIGGHVPYGLHKYLETSCDTFKYIVFLRDPIKRWISEFNHSIVFPSFVKPIWDRCSSKEEFLKTCVMEERNTNIMTKQISGLERFDNVIQDHKNYMFMWAARKSTYSNAEMEKMLETAKRNLSERYDYVGITSSGYHKKMCRHFGWPYKKTPRINVSTKPSIDWSENQSQIEDLNRYDIQLFEYARDLCQKR